jgi:hypothetical protein
MLALNQCRAFTLLERPPHSLTHLCLPSSVRRHDQLWSVDVIRVCLQGGVGHEKPWAIYRVLVRAKPLIGSSLPGDGAVVPFEKVASDRELVVQLIDVQKQGQPMMQPGRQVRQKGDDGSDEISVQAAGFVIQDLRERGKLQEERAECPKL